MSKMTTEIFKEKASKVHNNFYDYSKSIYINYRTKLLITCPEHGDFEQRIDHHLNGFKCKLCGCKEASEKILITKEIFLKRAKEIHGDEYTYPSFTPCKAKDKIKIVCKIHGEFEQSYDSHLNCKSKCPICSQQNGNDLKRKSLHKFISEANKVHNNCYTYENSIYKSNSTLLTITCKTHGDFLQTPSNHLQGKGCKLCAKETNAFSKKGFSKVAGNKECTFYVLKCSNENETFYKIGITSRSVTQRYPNKRYMPYSYETLLEIKGTAEFVWKLEQKYKKLLSKNKYKPTIKFGGSLSECFTSIPLEFS